MSLFNLKNLWVQAYPEQFDHRHLAVGFVDDAHAIGLASFAGTVRVHRIIPKSPLQADLVYQNTFQSPIIALQFIEHPELGRRNTLGILMFRKLAYLSLKINRENGTYTPTLLYVNVQPAFGFTIDPPAVVTLNSTIQYLNPVATQKIKVSDPIYPFSQTAYGVYHGLYYADGEELVFFMNSVEQWRVIVGPMRQIQALEDVAVVIGDNALWEVSEARINKTKILDDDVSCGAVIRKTKLNYNILVGNFSNQIFIYDQNYTLLWAVKMQQVPLKICVMEKKQLNGALCILGDSGSLSISFLGSSLSQNQIQPLKDQIQNQDIDSEIKRYLDELNNKGDSQGMTEKQQTTVISSDETGVQISVKPKQPKFANSHVEDEEKYFKKDGRVWSCDVECLVVPEKQPIFNVKCFIQVPSNIEVDNLEQFYSSIRGRQVIMFTLYCSAQKFPFTSDFSIILRFEHSDKKKGTNVLRKTGKLPIDFQCSLKNLQLEDKPSNKIVLKGSKQLPLMSKLFYQYERDLGETKNATFQLSNGVLCSIGYNKGSTKVKIESNFFSGLCFLYTLFWHRFKERTKDQNELAADIPLEELFGIMKDHFEHRNRLKEQFQVLDKKSEQFRSTQKKLLIKMKQKVSSINHIDKLLEYTYRSLMKQADKYEIMRDQMQVINHNLEISLEFVTQMLFMKSNASEKCKEKVMGIVGYEKENASFGWEEKVMSNSGFYLGKKYQYETDKYNFDQVYKIIVWVISKINSGEWN